MREYPITLTQLLLQLYQMYANAFKPIAMSADFLSALAATLFQQNSRPRENSQSTTPDQQKGISAEMNNQSLEGEVRWL